jgi:lysine 2,3-aminomutase
MVKGVEDLRTPLSVILDLEQRLRGTLSGFMMPFFVVDLPGGGGKRLAHSYESYDPSTGVSTFLAPGLHGEKGKKVYQYYDPLPTNAVDTSIDRGQFHTAPIALHSHEQSTNTTTEASL